MSKTQVRGEMAVKTGSAPRRDMKLEVVIIPVADAERANRFYGGLGWRLDADFAGADDFRVIQFTPPGSLCSIQLAVAGSDDAIAGSRGC
jgi:catechol 2,3-dioxygenase-like lactoylglutathione lyase family enzyme